MKALHLKQRDVRLMLAQKRVTVDGVIALNFDMQIDKFSVIEADNENLQHNKSLYIMLNKPIGVVCATKDELHKTVIDLIDHPEKSSLHIVGRLDLNTSGLVLLTNDSRWSERLTLPQSKVVKVYHVTLKNELNHSYIEGFKQGMYFEYENITTKPAQLDIISKYTAQVRLTEGKYHQIKRMFGRYQNPVVALHRSQVGNLMLDQSLQLAQSRHLTEKEVMFI